MPIGFLRALINVLLMNSAHATTRDANPNLPPVSLALEDARVRIPSSPRPQSPAAPVAISLWTANGQEVVPEEDEVVL